MSPMPTRQSAQSSANQGPSRFQSEISPDESPSVASRVGYLMAVLALVFGVPALLLWLSGPPPIPTSLPSRDDLTSSIGMEQVVTVLVAIVWLAWLQFVTCVAVELLSTLRHGGVPTPVPFAGPSQRLARTLVGGLLLAGVVGGQVASVVNAAGSDPRPASTISNTISNTVSPGGHAGPSVWLEHAPGAAVVAAATPASSAADAIGRGAANSAASGQSTGPVAAIGKKVYTVSAAVGHHHDSLWEIAEKHLGDGRRYKEIFALNEGVLQVNGAAMQLARSIQPGWQLVMPEDAVGVARQASPPAAPAQTPSYAPTGSNGTAMTEAASVLAAAGSAESHVDADSPQSPGVSDASHLDQSAAQEQIAPVNPLVAGLATSGLFGACVLSALLMQRRRRRGGAQPGEEALDAEVGLRLGASLDRGSWLDLALRNLSSTCADSGHPLPPVYAARLDDEHLELLLAPARKNAPDPWAVSDDGRRWVLNRIDAPRGMATGQAAYPALVCLGRDDQGRDVLVDLEASGGPVQITGDPVVASQVAAALAIQLGTSPWSDTVRVSALGLPAEVTSLAGARIDAITDLGPVVARLEARGAHTANEVLTGRLARVHDEVPEYLILSEPIEESLATRVAAFTAGARHPFGVVAVGAMAGAQWRLEVDEAGTLSLPLLDISVTAHRLTSPALAAVADLFAAADTEPPSQPGARPVIPATPQNIDDATFAAAPVRVGILGPVEVKATGPLDPSRVPLAEEVVTYLAAHPGGVHPGVLAAAIWPRGVTHAVASATIDRIGDWLGDEPDGTARLRVSQSGRYVLALSVAIDWHSLCALLTRSRNAGSPGQEAELLRRALRLVRGPVMHNRPAARYTWLVRTPLERTIEAVVVDAAHRLAEISSKLSDPAESAEAAVCGLRLSPTAQVLWRDLLEARHRQGGAAALLAAVADMRETMDRAEAHVDAETEALIEHLMATGSATGT